MKKTNHIISIVLTVVIAALSFMTGCSKKEPEITLTHHEYGSATLMFSEVYEECMANNDTEGAHEAVETYRYLSAFYTGRVYFEDFKNRNYNNINYDIGSLQIAVAAYNEYNDESAMDVEVDWICQLNSCTQEQHNAVGCYVEWYHNAQYGNDDRTIEGYRHEVVIAFNEIRDNYNLPTSIILNELTPAQFREVQNYMKDPDYQVDLSVWE